MHIQQQGVTSVSQVNNAGPGAAQTATPDPDPQTDSTGRRAAMHTTDVCASTPTPYTEDHCRVPGFLKIPISDTTLPPIPLALHLAVLTWGLSIPGWDGQLTETAALKIALDAQPCDSTLEQLKSTIDSIIDAICTLIDKDKWRRTPTGNIIIPESWSYDGGLTMWGAA